MALALFLTLKGQKQGDIKGSVTQKGHEGAISVLAVDHGVQSPRDAASGLPTGKRMHKPIVITKQVDQGSPHLYTALVNNENLVTWKLDFFRPSGVGAPAGIGPEALFYSIVLTDATVSSIHFAVPDASDPEAKKLPDYEEVAFVYRKIQWTYNPGNIVAMDDWMAAV